MLTRFSVDGPARPGPLVMRLPFLRMRRLLPTHSRPGSLRLPADGFIRLANPAASCGNRGRGGCPTRSAARAAAQAVTVASRAACRFDPLAAWRRRPPCTPMRASAETQGLDRVRRWPARTVPRFALQGGWRALRRGRRGWRRPFAPRCALLRDRTGPHLAGGTPYGRLELHTGTRPRSTALRPRGCRHRAERVR